MHDTPLKNLINHIFLLAGVFVYERPRVGADNITSAAFIFSNTSHFYISTDSKAGECAVIV